MKDNSLNKLGGLCAILTGISYILIGVLFLLLPADQQPGGESALFFPSVIRNPTLIRMYYLVFALGAVLALGALPAITEGVRSLNEGWTRWAANLAYLGFGVTAIDFFRLWSVQEYWADVFVDGDPSTQAAIDALGQGLDPQGWLGFGGVGVWVLVVSLLAMRAGTWPKMLSYIGIAVAAMYWLLVVANVFGIWFLISIVAGLGGVILAPIWFIWLGLLLRRTSISVKADTAQEM
jgi:Domain of unknown function (DUF4386)